MFNEIVKAVKAVAESYKGYCKAQTELCEKHIEMKKNF